MMSVTQHPSGTTFAAARAAVTLCAALPSDLRLLDAQLLLIGP